MMDNNTAYDSRQYDVYITYADREPDKKVALELAKQIRSYKIPGSLRKRSFQSYQRIYIDNPADNPNPVDILNRSRFLVVVCSLATPFSPGIHQLLQLMKACGRDDEILVVLIEGEPAQAFPQELLWKQRLVDGEYILEQIEPLAANVKARTLKSSLKLLKEEKLRILAPILGSSYFELSGRFRERTIKKIVAASTVVFLFFLVLISIVIAQYLNTKKQQNIAETQIDVRNEIIGKLFQELPHKFDEDSEAKNQIVQMLYHNFINLQEFGEIKIDHELLLQMLTINSEDSEDTSITKMILQRKYIGSEKALETLSMFYSEFSGMDTFDENYYDTAVLFTQNIGNYTADAGKYVIGIESGERIGDLKPGDIIISLEGKPIALDSQYRTSTEDSGKYVEIAYLRIDENNQLIEKKARILFSDYLLYVTVRII